MSDDPWETAVEKARAEAKRIPAHKAALDALSAAIEHCDAMFEKHDLANRTFERGHPLPREFEDARAGVIRAARQVNETRP